MDARLHGRDGLWGVGMTGLRAFGGGLDIGRMQEEKGTDPFLAPFFVGRDNVNGLGGAHGQLSCASRSQKAKSGVRPARMA